MADRQSIRVRKTLKDLFSDQKLNSLARETRFVKRQRKIKPVAFFWTLVLAFGVGTERRISRLRRAYERSTGVTLVPSSFYDRFTAELVAFMKGVVEHALNEFGLAFQKLGNVWKAFEDIMITDSTLIKLHDALAKLFPGTRSNTLSRHPKQHSSGFRETPRGSERQRPREVYGEAKKRTGS